MPTSYNFTQDGDTYSFDDVFVPVELFQSGNFWTWGGGSTTQTTVDSPGISWKQVSCGFNYRSGIQMNGSLWSWGNNDYGQLGDNTTNTRSSPVQEFTESLDWKEVSCGDQQTIAIKTNGTLWSWGQNDTGELGLGDTAQRNSPTQIGTDTIWKQVSCGYEHSAAVKTDGTLWVWGRNNYGQIGDGTTGTNRLSPVQIAGTNWKQVSCGKYHTSALKDDGTLWSWGQNYTGALGVGDNLDKNTPTQVGTNTDWKQVSCGDEHSSAIKTNGTLYVWGLNNFTGRLGTNDSGDKYSPTEIYDGGFDWKIVDCGRSFIAIKTDGTLWSWGSGDNGQLGTGTVNNNPIPQQTVRPENDWKQVDMSISGVVGAVTYIDPVI